MWYLTFSKNPKRPGLPAAWQCVPGCLRQTCEEAVGHAAINCQIRHFLEDWHAPGSPLGVEGWGIGAQERAQGWDSM